MMLSSRGPYTSIPDTSVQDKLSRLAIYSCLGVGGRCASLARSAASLDKNVFVAADAVFDIRKSVGRLSA